MADSFPNIAQQPWEPGARHYSITPHDSTNFAISFRAIYVGGAGNVSLVDTAGTAVTYVGVPAGTVLPMRGLRVNSTNTTATSLVGIY